MRYFKIHLSTHIHGNNSIKRDILIFSEEEIHKSSAMNKFILSEEENRLNRELILYAGELVFANEEVLKSRSEEGYSTTGVFIVKEINKEEFIYLKNAILSYEYFINNF